MHTLLCALTCSWAPFLCVVCVYVLSEFFRIDTAARSMSDNWAMDLAREVQVYSTTDFTHDCQEFIQDSPAPEWNSPPTASTSSSENDYIVQEFSLQQHRDDGNY